jgi:hypothetical protein
MSLIAAFLEKSTTSALSLEGGVPVFFSTSQVGERIHALPNHPYAGFAVHSYRIYGMLKRRGFIRCDRFPAR